MSNDKIASTKDAAVNFPFQATDRKCKGIMTRTCTKSRTETKDIVRFNERLNRNFIESFVAIRNCQGFVRFWPLSLDKDAVHGTNATCKRMKPFL